MEIKTQAAFEKALKKEPGAKLTLVSGVFRLRVSGAVAPILILMAGAHLDVESTGGDRLSVTARGNSTVTARGNSTVTAWENSTVTARGNSTVTARENSTVTARENSTVTAWENSTVTAWENSTVTAIENSTVTAWGNSTVTAWENSTVTAWENSTVTAIENSTVTAWGNSTVTAWGNSTVTARENSTVTAWENSTVTAWGYAFVRVFSAKRIEAQPSCIVADHTGGTVIAKLEARVLFCPPQTTPEAWCNYYGVQVQDGVAIVFKALNEDFTSPHGFDYAPGSTPAAPDWDGGARECGGGLHFSPHPEIAREFHVNAVRYVACPVALADFRASKPGDQYPQKVKARRCVAPVWECDRNGVAIPAKVEAT